MDHAAVVEHMVGFGTRCRGSRMFEVAHLQGQKEKRALDGWCQYEGLMVGAMMFGMGFVVASGFVGGLHDARFVADEIAGRNLDAHSGHVEVRSNHQQAAATPGTVDLEWMCGRRRVVVGR